MLFDVFVGDLFAIALAYSTGIAVAYSLNRIFVFRSSGIMRSELRRFALVNLASLSLVASVTLLLSRWLFPALAFTWHPEAVAHAVGVASPAALSYLGHRHYTFSGATART